MSRYTRQDIIQMVEEEDVEFIRLQFTDIFGNLKNVAVTSSQLERVLDNQCMFDGSSIEGFVGIEESDLYLHPDLDTFTIFPWRPQQGKVARFICDICRPDGTPFEGDPRYVLKRAVAQLHELGYECEIGPECEFFLFHTDDSGRPTTETDETAGYFEMGPNDLGENARRDMVLTLEDMGFEIEASHHEAAPGQHEIDFKYVPALQAADDVVTFQLAVKTIAKRHGMHATFMPKPKSDANGSGMHINMSLSKDGRNLFSDPSDRYKLSREGYYFIGGLMKHIKAITCITNPTVNSYKRFVPGYDAPVYIGWSSKTRGPLVRVPSGRGENTRIELRSPDSTANPYLALAVLLMAGLDGIRNKIEPRDSIDRNIQKMTRQQREELKIDELPRTLKDAVDELEKDEFIQLVLGKDLAEKIIRARRQEYQAYSMQVTDWEIANYLHRV